MIRTVFVYVILISMTLHCSCRLGLLENLYQKRHQIKYALGLIQEIPIALCSSNYDFTKCLKIEVRADSQTVPQPIVHTNEINLFFVATYQLKSSQSVLLKSMPFIGLSNFYSRLDSSSIFHPPTLLV
jgi:hypothetical protein